MSYREESPLPLGILLASLIRIYLLGILFICVTTCFSICGFSPIYWNLLEVKGMRGKKNSILPHQVEVIIYNQTERQKQHWSAFGGLYTQFGNWKLVGGEEVTSLVVAHSFPRFALVLLEGPSGQIWWLLVLFYPRTRAIDLLNLLVSFLCLIIHHRKSLDSNFLGPYFRFQGIWVLNVALNLNTLLIASRYWSHPVFIGNAVLPLLNCKQW